MRKDDIMAQGYQPNNPTWYQQPRGSAPSQPPADDPQPAAPAPTRPAPAPIQRRPARPRAVRSRLLLAAGIIATMALAYVLWYLFTSADSALQSDDAAYGLGTIIAVRLALPFAVASAVGTMFTWLAYFLNKRALALAAGILFSVAIILMLPWFFMDIVQMILCYVAYARMRRAGASL